MWHISIKKKSFIHKSRDYLEFPFNRKGYSWTHVHFIKNSECARSMGGDDRGGHISLKNLLYWISSEKLFHECEGSCKGRFFSKRHELSRTTWRTTHDARRTTHDARPTTHDARRTTHDARPTHPHTHGMLQGSKGTLREQSSSA